MIMGVNGMLGEKMGRLLIYEMIMTVNDAYTYCQKVEHEQNLVFNGILEKT